ncbi:MAG: ester cyclase, partial [Gemmatimonadota bacterium]
ASLEEFKILVQDFRTQFPDASVTIRDVIEAGDRATIAWTFTGTNTGPGDFPPTGRSVEVSGVSVERWEGGKLVEELVFFDTLSFMCQLGVVELPG